uniref:Uncharacterized protein n=1 Tax=Ditylenchus dipsaci TaxID=166011 RepID=A0A915DAZ6_9BILA
MQPMVPFSPGFAPPLPSFFDSPLPSPMRNVDCMSPSYMDLYQQCGSVQSPQKKFDYNLNMIIKALNEQTVEPTKDEVKTNPSEKSPWMLEQSWRNNSSSSGSGNEVRAGSGAKVLTCSGCGAMKCG